MSGADDRGRNWLARAMDDPSEVFEHPVAVAQLTDLPYDARLDMLQRWLKLVGEAEADERERLEVEGAIEALEGGAALGIDEPDEAPRVHTYGVVEPSDQRKAAREAPEPPPGVRRGEWKRDDGG